MGRDAEKNCSKLPINDRTAIAVHFQRALQRLLEV